VSSLLILVPLIGIIVMNLPLGFLKRLAFPFALALALVQAGLTMFSPPDLWNRVLINFGGFGNFTLVVDSLSIVLLLSIAIVLFAALLVGWSTIQDGKKRFDFVNLLILAVIGMNGIVMVRDLFSLYVFLEVAGVASFVLISLDRDKDGLEGGFKYLILSAVATAMMLSAIALLLMTTGSTSFAGVATALKTGPNYLTVLAVAIFVGGLSIKGGLVPFHGWLPDAYSSAPAGASVLLAGIVTKTTGIYTVIRLVTTVFGFTPQIRAVLLFVGGLSIVVGALAALGQKDFKRMLAYSSISQMGYIILSLGTGSPLGIAGAVFHLFNHAIFKTQLFVNAAAVEEQTGTRDMDVMGGLSARMPVTGATSVVAFLSTAGIPPLSGFWSKLIIIVAVWVSGYHIYAMVALLASLITCAYFLSMQRRVFFGTLVEEFKNIKEAKLGILIPEVVLALITIGVGVLFPHVLNSFILPIKSILG
jgi:multicomponent Na+:H+ antiporter subunit D